MLAQQEPGTCFHLFWLAPLSFRDRLLLLLLPDRLKLAHAFVFCYRLLLEDDPVSLFPETW